MMGLIIGALIGLVIGGGIAMAFTDTTFSEFIHRFYRIDLSEGVLVFIVAIGAFIASLAILVPLHELGHLICGLLSGYKFVSFRIFNLTFIKIDGKLRVKRFSVAGTGGQCLLNPPDLPMEEIPTGWYNFGGILVNLIILVLVAPLFLLKLNPFVAESLGIFIILDVIMLLMNGIPVRIGGVGNDAYNMKLLKNNPRSKRGIINQLRANALIQRGVRPKDMPDDLFACPDDIDYKNSLEITVPLMNASRLIDLKEYDSALESFEALYEYKDEIMPIYVKEIECELVFLYLRTGRPEKAEKLLTKDLKKYIEVYRKVMSSKERLHAAITLYLEHDAPKACGIFKSLKARKENYLLSGEVAGDLAIMEDMLQLGNNNA